MIPIAPVGICMRIVVNVSSHQQENSDNDDAGHTKSETLGDKTSESTNTT